MRTFKSWTVGLLLLVALGVALTACGGGGSSSSSETTAESTSEPAKEGGSGGGKTPPKLTIGVVPVTMESEFVALRVQEMEKAAAPLGWTVVVADGQANPQVMEQGMQKLVGEKVDAICTIGLGGEEIPKGFTAAKAAGIPVIALTLSPSPTEVKNFAGIFADDVTKMGEVAGEYIAKERADIPVIGSRLTQNETSNAYTEGILKVLEEEGLETPQLKDAELTDMTNSMTKNLEAELTTAPPGPLTVLDFSDFGTPILQPVLEKAGRESETAVLTRYEDPATMRVAENSELEVLMATSKVYQHIFNAYTALLAYAEGTPLPKPEFSVFDAGVHTIEELPAGAESFFDFEADLAKQVEEWSETYELAG
ncbi:MAG: substrate-binding domain-containing protein [Actinobacteria bacterium]|nr:substrate-binding domain-containing protein [Actinomycetota bacterium]